MNGRYSCNINNSKFPILFSHIRVLNFLLFSPLNINMSSSSSSSSSPSFYVTTIHAYNVRLCPLLGFPLNALLFWLILTKTPKEMRVHSRILLQTCILDILYLSLTLVATNNTLRNGPMLAVFLDGFFVRIFRSILHKHPTAFISLIFVNFIIYFFDIYSISVQFVYRYLILNRDVKINFGRYVLMLAFPFAAAFALSALWMIQLNGRIVADEPSSDELPTLFHNVDWTNSIYFVFDLKEGDMSLYWVLLLLLFNGICVIINVFCAIKMVSFVGAHVGMNPRMKELNRQLTMNLIILALFPLAVNIYTLTVCICILGILWPLIFGSSFGWNTIIQYLQMLNSLFTLWLPLANALSSIWINRPYREAVHKFISKTLCFFKKNNSANIVHPNAAVGQQ